MLAGLVAAAFALAAPAVASASVVGMLGSSELLVFGLPGEKNDIAIRYSPAGATGPAQVSDQIVVEDAVGVVPDPAGRLPEGACANLVPTAVTCDTRVIGAIRVALNDGNDRLVVNAKGAALPARFPVAVGGGDGNDVIRGGLGGSQLFGEAGNDIVAGWSGDDLLGGGPGSDGLLGFEGDDTLKGGPGADALFGQKGRDRLFGEAGIDVLLARDGRRDRVVNCGPGPGQRAVVDRVDPRAKRCKQLLPKKKSKKGKKKTGKKPD